MNIDAQKLLINDIIESMQRHRLSPVEVVYCLVSVIKMLVSENELAKNAVKIISDAMLKDCNVNPEDVDNLFERGMN